MIIILKPQLECTVIPPTLRPSIKKNYYNQTSYEAI